MRESREQRFLGLVGLLLCLSAALTSCDGDGASPLVNDILNSITIGSTATLGATEMIVCIPYAIDVTQDAGGRALTLTFQYQLGNSGPFFTMTEISPATAMTFAVTVDTPTVVPSGMTMINGIFYWQIGADLGFVGSTVTASITVDDGSGSTVTDTVSITYSGGNAAVVVGGAGGDDLTPGIGGSSGRSEHTAHAITSAANDGQLVLAGGQDSNLSPLSVDRFAVNVGARSYVPNAIGGTTRIQHASSFFYGASNTINVLVTGGHTTTGSSTPDNTSTVYTFSPTEGANAGPNMLAARQRHASCWLPNNRILITGGEGVAGGMVNDPNGGSPFPTAQSAEIYDPATNTFTAATHMPFARADHTCCLLPDGTVLVAGGRDPSSPTAPLQACIYNPSTDTWTTLATVIDRYQHTATLLTNGVCYLVGGRRVSDNMVLSDAHAYRTFPSGVMGALSPAGFSAVTDSLAAGGRTQHATTLLGSGSLLVVGGFDESASPKTALASAEVFTPTVFSSPILGLFSSIASNLAFARARHSMTTITSGSAIVVGGVNDDSNAPASFLDSIEVYQFNNNPPVVSIPTVGATTNLSSVNISFNLSDTENDRSFVFVRFSTNNGQTYRLATLASFMQTVNLAPGASTVTWNAAADGITAGTGSVRVQVIPVCAVFGVPQETTVNF